MTVSMNALRIGTQRYSILVQLRVHIEIITISFKHIGSHFEFMKIV